MSNARIHINFFATLTLRRLSLACIAVFAIVCSAGLSYSVPAQQPADVQAVIGDKYADLLPEQKALVEDWFKRFGEVTHKTLTAAEGYDNLPVSTKTTSRPVPWESTRRWSNCSRSRLAPGSPA